MDVGGSRFNLETDENTRKGENVSKSSYSSKRQKRINLTNGVDDESGKKYEKFTGLVNKRNDCWLNCLLQCFNALPLRRNLLDGMKDVCVSNVTAAITKVMNDMDCNKHSSIYPGELHRAMQNRYNIVANEQRDIHESFTTICSDGEETGMNDVVASHFHIGSQFRTTCRECGSFKDGTPETHTSLIVHVLNGIDDLEKAIETNMKEDITVRCIKCDKDTTHMQVRNFVFLPETLALCFTRFEVNNGITRKNSAKVQLPIELKQLGNMSCHYEFRSLALHHGTQIENGHYNALVVADYEVFLLDDEVISEVTDDWFYRAQRTVYLAFYTIKGPSYSLTTHLENEFYPMRTENENNKQKSSHTEDRCRERDNSNVRNNSSDPRFKTIDETINQVYDASQRHKIICSHKSYCFDEDLKGEDFKTLEYPVENTSYLLQDPGWLNDKIVDAYILLLVEAASKKGIRVQALNCFFYTRLKKFAIYLADEEKLLRMILERNAITNFEECDYILIPINRNNHSHWTTMVLDIWNSSIYYYDPIGKGIQNHTAISLIRFFFDAFYKWRKTCEVRINSKLIIKDFDVIWENSFDCQKDSSSCGVFVLMYISHKLGLLTYDPASEMISNIRNSMALELLIGKHSAKRCQKYKETNINICSCATSYKQEIGKEVTLYCKAFPSFGNKFRWTLGRETVSNEQVYKFRVTEGNIGTYFCFVDHEDGEVSACSCDVAIMRRPNCDRNLILNELKIAMATFCNGCV